MKGFLRLAVYTFSARHPLNKISSFFSISSQSFPCLLTYLFIQHTEGPLHARHCSRRWEYSSEQNKQKSWPLCRFKNYPRNFTIVSNNQGGKSMSQECFCLSPCVPQSFSFWWYWLSDHSLLRSAHRRHGSDQKGSRSSVSVGLGRNTDSGMDGEAWGAGILWESCPHSTPPPEPVARRQRPL